MTAHPNGLAERAYSFGLASLADAETLELFLSRSLQRGASTYAQALLARFGSLQGVLAAELTELAAIVDRPVAVDLKLLHDTTRRLLEAPIRNRCLLTCWSHVLAYLKHDMAHRGREQFRVLFLDKKNRLIADVVMAEGTVDHAPVYPREIMRRALELDASSVILVHNHPSGDPTPSRADIDMTVQVVAAGKALKVLIHDHVIVGLEGVVSMKALGLF